MRTESKRESSPKEHALGFLNQRWEPCKSRRGRPTQEARRRLRPNCHADQATSKRRPGQRHKTGWSPIGATKTGRREHATFGIDQVLARARSLRKVCVSSEKRPPVSLAMTRSLAQPECRRARVSAIGTKVVTPTWLISHRMH